MSGPELTKGDRIRLVAMNDPNGVDQDAIAPGSTGTVRYVTSAAVNVIGVDWDDSPRHLNLLADQDAWEKI